MVNPTTADIRQFIVEKFSDEDLEIFCADYFRDVYDNFTLGETKVHRIQLLIDYCQRRDRWPSLLAALEKTRPDQFGTLFPQEAATLKKSKESQPGSMEPGPKIRNPRQIFICYAYGDEQFAHRLADDLERRGWPIWIAPDSIHPGEKWVAAIERGLAESGVFLVVLTPSALKSSWVTTETQDAIALNHRGEVRVIPLYVQPSDITGLLETYQYVSFIDRYENGLAGLVASLEGKGSDYTAHQAGASSLPTQKRNPAWSPSWAVTISAVIVAIICVCVIAVGAITLFQKSQATLDLPTKVPTIQATVKREQTATPMPTQTDVATQVPVVSSTMTALPQATLTTAPATFTPAPRPALVYTAAGWFFTPHPDFTMRNLRSTSITIQDFEGGRLVWMQALSQTWILYKDATWANYGGDIGSTYQQAKARLGNSISGQRAYTACAGDTLVDNVVTAYISDPDNRVLSWRIIASSMAPLDWSYVPNASVIGCQ